MILKDLVESIKQLDHDYGCCQRSTDCDNADFPEGCVLHTALRPCPSCMCSLTETRDIAKQATQIINEAENGR